MNHFFIQFKATRGGYIWGEAFWYLPSLTKYYYYYYYYHYLLLLLYGIMYSLRANYSVLDQDIPVNLKSIQ